MIAVDGTTDPRDVLDVLEAAQRSNHNYLDDADSGPYFLNPDWTDVGIGFAITPDRQPWSRDGTTHDHAVIAVLLFIQR